MRTELITNYNLETICNPGLRERHWDQMGNELGFEVKHGPDMTLSSMIDAGLHKLGDKLQVYFIEKCMM